MACEWGVREWVLMLSVLVSGISMGISFCSISHSYVNRRDRR